MGIIERTKAAFAKPGTFRTHLLVQSTGTIFSQLIPIAISPLLTRLFSPVDFGLYGTVVSVSVLLAILITLRVDHGIMITADDEEAKNTAILSLLLATGASLAFAVLALIILALISELDGQQVLIWAIFVPLASLLAAATRTLTLFGNRLQVFGLVSKARISQAFCVAGASLFLGYFAPFGHGLIVALLGGNLLYVLMLCPPLRPIRPLDMKTSLSLLKANERFIRFSLPADLINTLSSRIPFIIFPALFGLEQTGYLALAYRVIATPARFVGTAIGEVFYSHAAREYERTGACWSSAYKIALALGALGLVGFSLLFVLADPVFTLVFGAKWQPAALFTQILTPMLLISFVVSPLSVVFYITGRQKDDFLWQIIFLAATTAASFLGVLEGGAPISLVAYSVSGATLYLVYFALIRRYAMGAKGAQEIS